MLFLVLNFLVFLLQVHSEALQDKDRVHKGSLDALQGAIDKEKAQRELDRCEKSVF